MTDEEHENYEPSEDDYDRRNGASSLQGALAAVDSPDLAELLGRDDEWWEKHEARVRREQSLTAEHNAREAMKRRGGMLKSADCCFPAKAVDDALAVWPLQTAAQTHVESWTLSPRPILVLAGGRGTGKTTAATWSALSHTGSAPAFIRASELEARGRYDKHLREWLRARSMLVIDDLGAEVLDGRRVFRSFFDEIIDLFYGDRKRLLITTNLLARRRNQHDQDEEPQLLERYGERAMSRLYESAMWGDCGSTDLREAR